VTGRVERYSFSAGRYILLLRGSFDLITHIIRRLDTFISDRTDIRLQYNAPVNDVATDSGMSGEGGAKGEAYADVPKSLRQG